MSNLLTEAIADANKVKEIAYENAKAAIEEVFQPKIQRMISSKLAEEDFEAEMEPELEPEVPEEDEFSIDETYVEDGKNGVPDNPLKNNGKPQLGLDEEEIDEEFERIIRELDDEGECKDEPEAEIQEKKDAAYSGASKNSKKNIVGETHIPDGEEPAEEEEPLDNLNLESLIKKLEEEEFGKSKPAPKAVVPTAEKFTALQNENARLKKENQKALQVIAEMKNTMNEVNLINTKLMYCSKIIHGFELTEAQQVKILETFDRAKSVREVKLVYATIQEHYKGRIKDHRKVGNKSGLAKSLAESASRTIKTVKANSSNGASDFKDYDRWQIFSGQKPIND